MSYKKSLDHYRAPTLSARCENLSADISISLIEDYLDHLKTADLKQFSPVGSTLEEMEEFARGVESVVAGLHKELGS